MFPSQNIFLFMIVGVPAHSLTGLSYKHEVEFSHTGNLQKLASKD